VTKLLLGLCIGFLFGWLLQKGHVCRRPVIVGQFLLRDFTVMKTMLTAITVGGTGVYLLHAAGWIALSIKPLQVGAIVVGGVLFGAGMVILGLCPGTCIAAAGEGSRSALWGLAGMLAGAAVFAELFPRFAPLLAWNDLGKVTLAAGTGVPWWVWFAALAVVLFFLRRLPSPRT
jgi:uncharacterized membrane protein YedE/YeeE